MCVKPSERSQGMQEMASMQNLEIDVEEYYKRYGPMVLRRCRQLLKDEAKALDAMQEVFTKLLVHKKRLKDRYPSSLLYRMSTNICLNMIRGDRFMASSDNTDILLNIAAHDDNEKTLVTRDLLDRLFKKYKKLVFGLACRVSIFVLIFPFNHRYEI